MEDTRGISAADSRRGAAGADRHHALLASNVEQLAINEGLFENSHITPAARANDATDIWVIRGAEYIQQPSRPFRTATIDHIKCGRIDCDPAESHTGADLGLYSVTFTNNLALDYETLRAFKEFREEAERKNFRYFLEVFDPNVDPGISAEMVDGFINDHIIRSLAGVTERGRPVFLKIVYRGPKAMEELAAYDPNLIVGILGGGAGTTYDAFKLIADAQKTRRARRAVWTQNQQRRTSARLHRNAAPNRRARDHARGSSARLPRRAASGGRRAIAQTRRRLATHLRHHQLWRFRLEDREARQCARTNSRQCKSFTHSPRRSTRAFASAPSRIETTILCPHRPS